MSLKKTALASIACAILVQYANGVMAKNLPEVESLAGVESMVWQAAEPNDTYIPEDAVFSQADESQRDMGSITAPQNPMLALFQKITALQEEIQELRGRVEEQEHQLYGLKQAQREHYLDLDKRLRAEGPQKIGGVSTAERESLEPMPMTGALDAQLVSQKEAQTESTFIMDAHETAEQLESISEEKIYNQAYQFIQQKDYESALTAFKSMMKSFPDGKYKSNGHYWMGEIYMVQGELDLAANEFNTVYQLYPKSPKAADALLKLGYVEYAKGQWERSKELLSKVQAQFPGSSSARLASTRLQRMQQERF